MALGTGAAKKALQSPSEYVPPITATDIEAPSVMTSRDACAERAGKPLHCAGTDTA